MATALRGHAFAEHAHSEQWACAPSSRQRYAFGGRDGHSRRFSHATAAAESRRGTQRARQHAVLQRRGRRGGFVPEVDPLLPRRASADLRGDLPHARTRARRDRRGHAGRRAGRLEAARRSRRPELPAPDPGDGAARRARPLLRRHRPRKIRAACADRHLHRGPADLLRLGSTGRRDPAGGRAEDLLDPRTAGTRHAALDSRHSARDLFADRHPHAAAGGRQRSGHDLRRRRPAHHGLPSFGTDHPGGPAQHGQDGPRLQLCRGDRPHVRPGRAALQPRAIEARTGRAVPLHGGPNRRPQTPQRPDRRRPAAEAARRVAHAERDPDLHRRSAGADHGPDRSHLAAAQAAERPRA